MIFGLDKIFTKKPIKSGLTYDDIPGHSVVELLQSSYPQPMITSVPVRSAQYFLDRYADELHAVLDQLPLSKTDINKLIMPVIERVIAYQGLLPASEYYHHSGLGGLLVHSWQCAAFCINFAESKSFNTSLTQQVNHNNKICWLVGACLTGLLHDVGKLFDLKVFDADGITWNPNGQSLSDWLNERNIDKYHFTWNRSRIHKQHELRSIRLIYACFLSRDLLEYLSKYSVDDVLGAMDDAIVMKTGPLADILRSAEACSIKKDAEDRRHLGMEFLQVSSPTAVTMFMAIRRLLSSEKWSVNQTNSFVFLTMEGIFLRLSDAMILDLRQCALDMENSKIPSDREGIIRVLREAQLLEPRKGTADKEWIWVFNLPTLNNTGIEDAVKLAESASVLPSNLMGVPAIPLSFSIQSIKSKKDQCFMAPTLSAPKEIKADQPASKLPVELTKPSSLTELSESEIAEVRTTPLTPKEAQRLIDRLILTIVSQVQVGKGELLQPVTIPGVEIPTYSTIPVETLLKNYGFDEKSSEVLFHLSSLTDKVDIDLKNHFFFVRRENQCSKKKMSVTAT